VSDGELISEGTGMSKYFPDVSTTEGAQGAAKAGVFGALAFSATILLGLVFVVAAGGLPGMNKTTPDSLPSEVVGIMMELVVVLVAAWRFHQQKGLIIGSIILLMFVGESIFKIVSKSTNIGWIIFYIAVATALVNGVRGAWAFRQLEE
jgi:hypothetical protein